RLAVGRALSHLPGSGRRLAGMGYQDRDYMRGEGSGGEGRSNPLWWILGLIALILVVAYLRRGTMSGSAGPQALQGLVEATGPLQTCEFELAAQGPPAERVVELLRSFFHEQGYDSTIHQTAAGTVVTATFILSTGGKQLSQYAIYHYVGSDHPSFNPRHTLSFQVYDAGAAPQSPQLEHSQRLSRQL